MPPASRRWIWPSPHWPALHFDAQAVQPALAAARLAQGRLLGLASSLQRVDLTELQLSEWTQEAVATAQIEGEVLQVNSVRASVTCRLGLPGTSAAACDARTEATLDVLQAAVTPWQRPLTAVGLFARHAALFPTGRSGLTAIVTGGWRAHPEPMQIVTPRLGRPGLLHNQAPASAGVPAHMATGWHGSTSARAPLTAWRAPRWPTCGSRPSIRLKTATAASAAPWPSWRWRKTCKARSG